jgi:hypothetical protein
VMFLHCKTKKPRNVTPKQTPILALFEWVDVFTSKYRKDWNCTNYRQNLFEYITMYKLPCHKNNIMDFGVNKIFFSKVLYPTTANHPLLAPRMCMDTATLLPTLCVFMTCYSVTFTLLQKTCSQHQYFNW